MMEAVLVAEAGDDVVSHVSVGSDCNSIAV